MFAHTCCVWMLAMGSLWNLGWCGMAVLWLLSLRSCQGISPSNLSKASLLWRTCSRPHHARRGGHVGAPAVGDRARQQRVRPTPATGFATMTPHGRRSANQGRISLECPSVYKRVLARAGALPPSSFDLKEKPARFPSTAHGCNPAARFDKKSQQQKRCELRIPSRRHRGLTPLWMA